MQPNILQAFFAARPAPRPSTGTAEANALVRAIHNHVSMALSALRNPAPTLRVSLAEVRGAAALAAALGGAEKTVSLVLEGPLDAEHLTSLAVLRELRNLDLSRCEFSRVAIGGQAVLHQLDNLVLPGRALTDSLAQDIGELVNLRGLAIIGQAPLTQPGLDSLGRLSRLEALQISARGISRDGWEVISRLNTLHNLSLPGCKISAQAAEHIGLLQGLHTLDVSMTEIDNDALAHLEGLPALYALDLTWCPVSDAGLAHLARLPRLERLNLSQTRVTDAGLAALNDAPALRHVVLDCCAGVSGRGAASRQRPALTVEGVALPS